MTPLQAELSRALDELARTLAKTNRRRSNTEAPLELTNGYVAYLFACGQASLQANDRAGEYLQEARAGFSKRRPRAETDPVHAYAIGLCDARLEQALAGTAYHAPLAGEHVVRLSQLDRLSRYKVDQFRDSSLLLETDSVDALERFSLRWRGRGHERAAEAPPAVAEPPPPIREIIESREVLDDATLARCLDELLGLAEDPGVPLLVELLPRIANADDRLGLYARALTATAHLGWGELAPDLLDRMHAELRTAGSPYSARVVSAAIRAMRRLGMRAELAAWIDDWESRDDARLDLILAAGRTLIGDARGGELLARGTKRLDQTLKHSERLDHIRRLAVAYAHADLAAAQRDLLALTRHFQGMSDTFGANTHFCLSVLTFVDALIYGLVGLDFSRPGWEPRE